MTESTSQDHFHLLVYRGTGGETVPLADYLDLRKRGACGWTPYLGLVGLDLTAGGEPRWSSSITIGDLARTAFQLEAAGRLIHEGAVALVRIGVDDSPVGGFFRFRPEGDLVRISLVEITAPDLAYRYPVDWEGRPVAEVYARIAAAGDRELGAAPRADHWPRLHEVAFPRERLERNLVEEAARGRELYDVLGQSFDLELY